jgi:PAS domain S-box-containing protein
METSQDSLDQRWFRPSTMYKLLFIAVGYLVAYLGLVRLALCFAAPTRISPWYPAAGLSVALLTVVGWRSAPLVLLGMSIAYVTMGPAALSPWILLGVAVCKTAVYTLTAGVLRRKLGGFVGVRRVYHPRDVLWFVLLALIPPFFAALISLSVMSSAGMFSLHLFQATLLQFWIGDAIGVMFLTPFLLLLVFPALRRRFGPGRVGDRSSKKIGAHAALKSTLQTIAMGVAIWLAFGSPFAGHVHMYYLLFFPLVWIAYDYGLRGAAMGIVLLNLGCMSAVHYYRYDLHNLYELQILLLFTSMFGLLFGAVVDARRQVERRAQTAYTFLEIANRHTEMDALLKEVIQEVKRVTGCQAVGIRVLDDAGNIPYEAYEGFSRAFYESESPLSIEVDRCMCIDVIRGETDSTLPFFTPGGSFFMNGTTRFLATVSEEEKGETRNVCNAYGFESVALVPIRNNGRILGLIHVADRRENQVPLHLVERLEVGASQLGANLQRLSAQLSLRQRNRELALLNRVSQIFNATLQFEEVVSKILTHVQKLLDVTACSLWLKDPQTGDLLCREAITPQREVVRGWRLPPGVGVVGWVAEHGEGVVIPDIKRDPRHDTRVDRATGTEMHAVVAVPLRTQEGIRGVLQILDQTPDRFTREDLELLETLAAPAAMAVENAQLYRRAQQELAEREYVASVLRESESRFRRMANTAPVMIWMSEVSGGCTYFNDRWLMFRGRSLAEEQGEGWVEGVHPDDRSRCLRVYREALEREEAFSMEYRLQRADGDYRWIFDAGAPRFTPDGDFLGMIGACTDITERKAYEARIQHEVRRAEALLRVASRLNRYHELDTLLEAVCEECRRALDVESASVLLYDAEREHFTLEIVVGLPKAYQTAYQPPPLAVYRRYAQDDVVVVPDVKSTSALVNQALHERHNVRTIVGASMTHQDELLGVLNVHTLGEPCRFTEEEIALLRGIADQAAQAVVNVRLFDQVRASQQRLEQMSKRLVEAQETERRHLARELHDEIGQALTVLKLNLQAMQRLTDDEQLVEPLQDNLETVEHTLQQVRTLSLDLRPSLLDDLGLVPALRWFVDRQGQQADFSANFVADVSSDRFAPEVEIAYFRIVQEALTNVMRHAQAEHVHVELEEEDGHLVLLIHDDGMGFDVTAALEAATHGVSLGLSSMRERAALLGGEIEIDTAPGRGTEIRVAVPLSRAHVMEDEERAGGGL